jgi:hypothetical protein
VRDENGNLVLDEVYQVNLPDPMDVTLNIEFTKPELLKTDQEKIEIAKVTNRSWVA